MRLGAISSAPSGPDSQGYTYGTLANGNDVQCPPGQPYDPSIMDCSGSPCLPMILGADGAYTLPSGPLAPGQSVCPAPGQGSVATDPPAPSVSGMNWALLAGVLGFLVLMASGRR